MPLTIPEVDSVSPKLYELAMYAGDLIPRCSRTDGKKACEQAKAENVGKPFDNGTKDYQTQKIKIFPKGNISCANCPVSRSG